MPRIEIIGPDPAGERGMSAWGTRLLVDGREIDEVRSLVIRANLDAALTVEAEMFITEHFQFEGAADLHVTVVTEPGFVVVKEAAADGTTRYRAERAEATR